MKVSILAIISVSMLGGCVGSSRPSSPGEHVSALTYDYVIPDTSAKLALQVTITECSPSAQFKIEPTLTVSAVRSPARYHLVGGDLSGWFTSHDLALTSYETGALKTINSADSDRTFAVVTNVIKGIVSIAAIAGTPNPSGIDCSVPTKAALTALQSMKARRKQLAALLPGADPAKTQELAEAIAALDAEIGRVATSDALTFQLPAKSLDLMHKGGTVEWSNDDMPASLMGAPPAKFAVAYCLDEQTGPEPSAKCSGDLAAQGRTVAVAGTAAPAACGTDTRCSRTIVLREPKRAVLTLVGQGDAFGKVQGKTIKAVALPVAQWGNFTMLSTRVGLGRSRTVGFSLDEYGGKTSFAWKSDARAESITGGVASALEPAAGLAGTIRGHELAEDKAELDRLDTEHKLKAARACKAIEDAGGTCPAS